MMHNYQMNWREEMRSAYFYQILANVDESFLRQNLFTELSQAALKQARIWEERMELQHIAVPRAFVPSVRDRIIARSIRLFGVHAMRYILSAMKIRGMSALSIPYHENRHTVSSAANNLRAAVFGMNDGLISNMSLILGMVGASASTETLLLAGVAGLLSGATSMAAGEYISVRSQRDVFEYQMQLEREELNEYPQEEIAELALIYETRGLSKEDALHLATLLIKNPETGLRTLAREELGLDPDTMASPLSAMFYSFVSFAVGAFLPLIPFVMFHKTPSLFASIGITGATLFLVGMLLSFYSNRSMWYSGFRMLFIGLLTGTVTYSVGKILAGVLL